jgi:hypothetical protein
MLNKIWRIVLNALPIALMIGLIPLVANDYTLALIYILIAVATFTVRREAYDCLAYALGLIAITISEYLFVQTGVETFARQSLWGIMPVWLPFLWAYAFAVIKRSLRILDR